MFSKHKTASLIAFVALFSAESAFTQTAPGEATPEAKASNTVAYVYVQTTTGVDLYDAETNGKLRLVSASPFPTVGEMIGSTGKYFISLGTNLVHAYELASDGAITRQVSTANTLDYESGSGGCNNGTTGAVLDHSGQDLYVVAMGSDCIPFFTFSIAKDSGDLNFGGVDLESFMGTGVPIISGNDAFLFGVDEIPHSCGLGLFAFARGSGRAVSHLNYFESTPWRYWSDDFHGGGGNGYQYPIAMTEDPTNHLAIAQYSVNQPENGNCTYGPPKLASYSVDSEGNISSSNTPQSLPTTPVGILAMNMSPTGKLLAVAGWGGMQIFHFNGADPITPYSPVLDPALEIDQIHWDNSDHLFALSYSAHKLYVYTVTPTSISEAPGSPYTIGNTACSEAGPPPSGCPNGLVVVSK